MIDFDLSHRPARPSEWTSLATAVHESSTTVESYWLETKTSLDWSTPHGLGLLARAIIGMANRDPQQAGEYLDGRGIVIVGLGPAPGQITPVAVLDPADLENKLAAYLGVNGPRWQPYWVKVDDVPLLVVEVDAPRNGDPSYTLRAKFDDFRVSQTFVRTPGSKTVPASQEDIERLARRFTMPESKGSLDVIVGFTLDTPLKKIYFDESATDAFIRSEEEELLASLTKVEMDREKKSGNTTEPFRDFDSSISGFQDMLKRIESVAALPTVSQTHAEKRTPEEFRTEVQKYIDGVRAALPDALHVIATSLVPFPRFWLSNESVRNFTAVAVTLRVEGDARAEDLTNEGSESLRSLLPKRPRVYGPYKTSNPSGGMYFPRPDYPFVYSPPMAQTTWIPGRREIRNGGSFEIDLEAIDLRPGEKEVELEAETVVLIPHHRSEAVVVKWTATASNVDAIAQGEFVLPFEGEPIDILLAGLDPTD